MAKVWATIERGQRVEIYGVNAAGHDQVAQDGNDEQQIHAGVEPMIGESVDREAPERGGRKQAISDQHEPAMILGLPAPIDCECEYDGEE